MAYRLIDDRCIVIEDEFVQELKRVIKYPWLVESYLDTLAEDFLLNNGDSFGLLISPHDTNLGIEIDYTITSKWMWEED